MIPHSRFVAGGLAVSLLGALSCIDTARAFTLADLTSGHDVFVRGNATFDGVHMHGSTAIGGDLTLRGSMSEFLNDNVVRPAGLAVGGRINQNADARINNSGKLRVGSLQAGQTVVTGSLKTSLGRNLYFSNSLPTADVVSASSVDMNAAFNQLGSLSASLASMNQTLDFNGFVSGGNNFNLTLGNVASGGFDVMNITGAQLASVQNLNFNHVAGFNQRLVINVDLSSYSGAAFVQNRNGNNEADNILWNFYGATNLAIQNQFIGSILAPGIDFTHSNNDVKGSVIARSFVKNGGQVHVHPFTVDFPGGESPAPPVPDAGSTGLLALLVLPVLAACRRWMR